MRVSTAVIPGAAGKVVRSVTGRSLAGESAEAISRCRVTPPGYPSTAGKEEPMVAVNVVILAGKLSEAPEVKEMPSGDHVTRFRLSVPESGKRVLPLPVSAWDRAARKGCDRLTKGDEVLVRGHLVRRFFRDGGGGRSVTEVVATEVRKLERPNED